MSNHSLSIQGPNPELKRAFLGHLPHRIAAIDEAWRTLCRGDWQDEWVQRFYQRVQALGGSCGKFGLADVGESVLSLEVFLSSFVDGGMRPKPVQIQELDALVKNLQEVAARVAGVAAGAGREAVQVQPVTSRASGERPVVFLLEDPGRAFAGLCALLGAHDFDTRVFGNTEELRDGMQQQRPAALISDVSFLSDLDATGLIDALKVNWPNRVPLVFRGDPSNLEQRLQAMRAGSDAFVPSSVEEEAIAAKIRELVVPPTPEPFRVLIVEDDPTQAEHAAAILRKVKMQTRTVIEPLKVLDTIREFRPRLILMDLYMPDADGVELTMIIREYREFVDIPIVFLSGEHDPDKQLAALSAGGEDFLDKPIRPRHLIKTVINRIHRAQELETFLLGAAGGHSIAGLLEHRPLLETLDHVIAERIATDGPTGLLFIGIDAAERVLDSLGIRGMDGLVAKIGALIADPLEAGDTAGRFGDYSFVVMAQRSRSEDVTELAEFLCKTVAGQLFELGGQAISVTLSIGVYQFGQVVDDASVLVSRAEKAYRVARDAGGNRAHVYVSREDREGAGKKAGELEGLIRKALEEGAFQVMFQPIVPLRGGEGEHYQTLLRLPAGGAKYIRAAEFVPVAERSELIVDVDRWVTEYALAVIKEKQESGNRIHLFVSQSVGSLNDSQRIGWLQERNQFLDLDGAELTFEFNMASVAAHLSQAKAYFGALQSLGISVLLTNVTAEAADLKLIEHLGVDFVKVAFEALRDKPEALSSLVEQVHELGKPVIAPRIEDTQVIAQLWISGVDFIQGNFIQRPDENLGFDFSESILA